MAESNGDANEFPGEEIDHRGKVEREVMPGKFREVSCPDLVGSGDDASLDAVGNAGISLSFRVSLPSAGTLRPHTVAAHETPDPKDT